MVEDKKEQKQQNINPGSVIKTALFTRPLTKFMLLLIIQLVAIGVSGYFTSNILIRIILLTLNVLITIYFVVVIIHVSRNAFNYLMSPKHIWALIGAYSLLIFVMLLIFSMLFSFIEVSHLGALRYGGCSDNFDPSSIVDDPGISREFFYFTAMTFFTVGYGDICPMGASKIVAVLAAFVGHVVSVLLVALIVNNYIRSRYKK